MDESLTLFGTSEPPEPRRMLAAGRLTATMAGGNLRHIRVDGHEAIRAISCVIRDHEWGTYPCEIRDLIVEEARDWFLVTYRAICQTGDQSYCYDARIEATPDSVMFRMRGEALTNFHTARLGFVVLHPIRDVSGHPVDVLHTDGRTEHAWFPDLIEPYQPFHDIRALTHEPAPGVRVTCRMEGDTFEMEDQRNWTDASFKTYVRPIGLPWPYLIRRGETTEQSVSLIIAGSPAHTPAESLPIRLSIGDIAGRLPALGLHLGPDEVLSPAEIERVRALKPGHLLVRHDLRHHAAATLRRHHGLADAVGARLHLEVVMPGLALDDEARSLTAAISDAGAVVETVLVVPAADLKGTLPGRAWPKSPELEDVYRAVRDALPGVRLGGGTFNFFTELNRKRPPAGLLDVVTFSTSAIVHAADDQTIMENLAALAAVFRSAGTISGGTPLYIGPSHIGCRDNPYGAAATPNPDMIRMAMTDQDPRQRGRFAAAWAVGYLANCIGTLVEAVTLSAPVSPFGIIHRASGEEPGHLRPGDAYPIYRPLRLVAGALRAKAFQVFSRHPERVTALAWRETTGTRLLMANLTEERQTVTISAGEHNTTGTKPAPWPIEPYAVECIMIARGATEG